MIDNSIMLPSSTCSTLAILIAFSRFLSLTMIRTMLGAVLCFHECPVPISHGFPVCVPESVSVAGLFALCCPLPLAVDDCISNLLLEFGSGTLGLSLKSCAAGADGSGSGIAAVVLSLFFLCSPLYLLSQCLMDHLTSSIRSFCSLWSYCSMR